MKKLFTLLLLAVTMTVFGQATYTWKAGTTGAYGTSTNWNPSRTSPAVDDILIFDLGNIDGSNTSNSITVSNITSNETIGKLQVIQAGTGTPSTIRTLTFSGTATTLTVTGDLVIGCYGNNIYCKIADGGNTISVGGNLSSVNNIANSSTLHTGAGKIVFTGASPTFFSGSTAGNIGFQNLEISATTNLTLGGVLTINGNLNINTGGTLTLNNKTFILNSTSGVGGTISGNGTLTATGTSSILYVQGTGPASGTQTVGTINFNTTSATASTVNSLNISRPNSITTIGTTNAGILNVAGGINLSSGTLNDGGNILKVSGSSSIATYSGTGSGTGIHTGTGKIQLNRGSASMSLLTVNAGAGTTVSLGNVEVLNSTTNTLYSMTAGSTVTITGTLTLSKSGSGIDASGANLIFQNADVPVVKTAGTITTNASTNLTFGTTSNTAGAAFTLPDGLFTATPSINNLTLNRDNTLSLGNQGITVNNLLTLTKGNLSLGASDLTIAAAATISGGSSASYIITGSTGKLTKTAATGVDKVFPIGTVSSFDPVTVNNSGTSVAVSAKVGTTLSGSASAGNTYNGKEWSIVTASGTTSAVITLSPAVSTYITGPIIGSWNGTIYDEVSATLSGSSDPYSYSATQTLSTSSSFTTGGSPATDIKTTSTGIKVYGANNQIIVENTNGSSIEIYSVTGAKVKTIAIGSEKASIAIEKGIYIVSVNNVKSKVLVK